MLKLMSGNLENEGPSCQKNSDCSSNICKMIYRNGEPIGRKCLMGSGARYTKSCRFPKDCQSGICEPIYDAAGRLVAKRCAKAKKLNRDNGFDKLLNKDSGYEKDGKYGVISNHAIKSGLQQQGRAGPITEAIIKIISIVFDLFSLIVYDFRVKPYNHSEQGIMYGLFASITLAIFSMFDSMGIGIPGGLISGIASAYNKDGKCDAKASRPIDMWYIRTIITILFPPLGVLMAKGFTGFTYILTSCLLTALFYFPGLVYSLAIISTSRFGRHEAAERKVGNKMKT